MPGLFLGFRIIERYVERRGVSTSTKAFGIPVHGVLLSSGYNEEEATRRFEGEGLAGFIQKPYTAAALDVKINDILRNG